MNNDPANAGILRDEGSGYGLISVFIDQTLAKFSPLVKCSAYAKVLKGLEENILRNVYDFFWASYLPKIFGVMKVS